MEQSNNDRWYAFIFLLAYLLVEYVLFSRLQGLFGYSPYLFNVFWVSLVLMTFNNFFLFKKEKLFLGAVLILASGGLGVLVQLVAASKGMMIPYVLNSLGSILFLFLIGPVIEEFVFRVALWKVFEVFIKNKWMLIFITTAFYAYSNFRLFHYFPSNLREFFYFQYQYMFISGLLFGYVRTSNGFVPAIFAHFMFNLGFWLNR